MLLIGRRPGEEIVIAENIKIRIVSINRGKVQVGIDAPKDVPVMRSDGTRQRKPEELETVTA